MSDTAETKTNSYKQFSMTGAFIAEFEKSFARFHDMSDIDLIRLYRGGDTSALEYLLIRHRNLVNLRIKNKFIPGADHDDILQVGMIGLFFAIKNFDEGRSPNFPAFASMCIKARLDTAIKSANRKKHLLLNNSYSLDDTIFDENDHCTFIEYLTNNSITNPEEFVICKENKKHIEESLSITLTELEQQVLYLYLKGKSYSEIAAEVDKSEKSIDNALQRVKKKVKEIIKDRA